VATQTAFLLSSNEELYKTVTSSSKSIRELQFVAHQSLAQIREKMCGEEAVLLVALLQDQANESVDNLLRFVTEASGRLSTVVLSDKYQDHHAVRFLRAGAAGYLGLPIEPSRLNFLLDSLTFRARNGINKNPDSKDPLESRDFNHFVLDPEIGILREQLRRVVAHDSTILLTGETGTGKTRLARLIHQLSPRRDQPFLVVDCASLSSSLVESEMFGHVKGAFTGADRDRVGKFCAAGSGTLLLDEVNSLPPELQSKLLRAVDERVFEPVGSNKVFPLQARLIVASNRSLEHEVAENRFRADLFYRLNVVGFHLPPLRERRRAIPELVNCFLAEFARRNGIDVIQIHSEAMRLLNEYKWPGNLRELRNVVERAASLCFGHEIRATDLPDAVRSPHQSFPFFRRKTDVAVRLDSPKLRPSLTESRNEAEVQRIVEALERNKNNRLRTAAELGISRMSLYKKLYKYGLMQNT
jgi:DNA-binding NtrC family response regulator